MENTIYYYYGISVDNLIKQNNYYYFTSKEDIYYFCRTKKIESELKFISKINNQKYHKIIKNINGLLLTEINDGTYCLLKINCLLNDVISFQEILKEDKIKMNKSNIRWDTIWQNKIDYLEEQMKELGYSKKILKDSFSYYEGLAENAISYYINNNHETKNISVVHYRISNPNLPINYYNPLNLIVDCDMRDYAEMIKSTFFNDNNNSLIKWVNMLLDDNRYNYADFILFYSRLLYPSYYFDIFNEIIDVEPKEDKIIKLIEKTDEYEFFLKDVYYEIKKKYNIPSIDWIIKKSNKL